MILGINHITLIVSDLDAAFSFYVDLLGFTPHVKWLQAAYVYSGDLWICLYKGDVTPRDDFTHLALQVSEEDYFPLKHKLENAGVENWRHDSAEENSFYILDPDLHKLEFTRADKARFLGITEPL